MGNLEQDKVLQAFVDQACEVTSSPYGALSILGSRGETSAFYIHGVSDELRNSLGNPPVGRGIIGDIPLDNGIISVSYTHLTLPTIAAECRSRWSPDH